MTKKMAFLLAAAVLSYPANVWADSPDVSGEKAVEETVVLSESSKAEEQLEESSTQIEETTESITEPTTEPVDAGSMESTEQPTKISGETTETWLEEEDKTAQFRDNTGQEEKNVLYNVCLPANTCAYLDPGDLSGRGQIFSDSYEVENCGNSDIAIKIKNIDISCKSPKESYEFSEEEITDSSSGIKKMNIEMVWEREDGLSGSVISLSEGPADQIVIYLEAADYDENGQYLGTGEGGMGHFYFTGTLNGNPRLSWEEDEVTVSFYYEVVDGENALEALEEEKAQEAETAPSAATAEVNDLGKQEEGKESEGRADSQETKAPLASPTGEGIGGTAHQDGGEEDADKTGTIDVPEESESVGKPKGEDVQGGTAGDDGKVEKPGETKEEETGQQENGEKTVEETGSAENPKEPEGMENIEEEKETQELEKPEKAEEGVGPKEDIQLGTETGA